MRYAIVPILMLLGSWVGAGELSPADRHALEQDCAALAANTHVAPKIGIFVALDKLPDAIAALRPISVEVNEEGVYIQLEDNPPLSSGLFFLPEQSILDREWVLSSGFEPIGGRLFRYAIHDG